jgi:hypothetical protein
VKTSNSDGLPRPEEFPLGSVESRAAARAMLESCTLSHPRTRTTQARTSEIGNSGPRVA